ncbi:MAG: hypothetical protein ACR2FG_07300 [Marmoricola sp.]
MEPQRPKRRLLAVLVLASVGAVALAGCGSSGSTASGATTQKIAITIKGTAVSPKNKRIAVPVDKPITLTITSDRSGELHLHSSPEQHIEFTSGTTVRTITLTVPGVVELEEHQSDTLLAQLEAR